MKSILNPPRLVLPFFAVLTLFIFRQYFFSGLIPLPANLLVSFYSPFRLEKWPGYEHGIPNKPIGSDILRLFYPYKKFTLEQLEKGKMPLWNPYVFAGNVHLATYQAAVLYPLNIVFLVIVQPVLTGWFTYLFLKSLRLSLRASFFGALAFTLSGWMVVQWEESLVVEHSFLWLPLALYGSQLIWRRGKSLSGFVFLVLALTFSVLAGFMQMTIYVFATTLAWNIYLWWSSHQEVQRGVKISVVVLAFAISFLLSATQLLPAGEAYLLSPRSSTTGKFLFEAFLMPFSHLATFVAPDFWGNPGAYNYFFPKGTYHDKMLYIGIFPLIFALAALFHNRAKEFRFWKFFTLATLSLGFALPTSWIWYVLKVPVLSVAHPGRNFALASFGLSVLSAAGLEQFWQRRQWWLIRRSLILLTGVLIVLWLFVAGANLVVGSYSVIDAKCQIAKLPFEFCRFTTGERNYGIWQRYATISLRNLLPPSIFIGAGWLIFVFANKFKRWLYFYILAITLASGLYFANKYLFFSERKFMFPRLAVINRLKELAGLNRVWGYGEAYFEPNLLSYYGLYSAEGYDAIFPGRYGELLSLIHTGGHLSPQIPRTDATLKPVSEKDALFDNFHRRRLMQLLNVKFILETKIKEITDNSFVRDRFPAALQVAWEDDKWRIWENREALPRAFVVPYYRLARDKTEAAELLTSPNFDPSQAIILERAPKEIAAGDTQVAPRLNLDKAAATIQAYEPERVEIAVDSPFSGFLFLSDNYFPGWRAYVDKGKLKF
ncbi:MAG: hypothetical protein ACOY0S_03335 [Patescibacteria group bacterium]